MREVGNGRFGQGRGQIHSQAAAAVVLWQIGVKIAHAGGQIGLAVHKEGELCRCGGIP